MITFEKSVLPPQKKLLCVNFRLRYDIGQIITSTELQVHSFSFK